jgi:hypothetical protein
MSRIDSTSSLLTGIHDLQRRLTQIEESCLGSVNSQSDSPEKMDKFLTLKFTISADLTEMRGKIADRLSLLKEHGQSFEVITLTSQIHALESEIDKNFLKLKETYRKQCDGGIFVFSKNTSNAKELSARYALMDNLAFQIEEAKKVFLTGSLPSGNTAASATVASESGGLSLRERLFGKAAEEPKEQQKGPRQYRTDKLDEHEQEAVSRWQAAEIDMDRDLEAVGHVVERLGEVAGEMSMQATKQSKMMDMIKERTDTASTGLKQVSVRLRQILDTERKSTFMCRVILLLILLGLGVWIWERAKSRV